MENKKPATRLTINQKEINKITQFCNEHQIHYAFSDFKIAHLPTIDKGVTNKGIKVELHSTINGDILIYLSKNKNTTQQLKQADENNNHKRIGELLGYPECCITFFSQNYHQQILHENEYILPALQNSGTLSFYNNIIMRYFDIGVLSHFPCSFHCPASIAQAKEALDITYQYSPELTEHMISLLKCPIVFTAKDGAHVLQGWRENNITGKIEFNKVLSTVKNNISYLLEKTGSIDRENPHLISFT